MAEKESKLKVIIAENSVAQKFAYEIILRDQDIDFDIVRDGYQLYSKVLENKDYNVIISDSPDICKKLLDEGYKTIIIGTGYNNNLENESRWQGIANKLVPKEQICTLLRNLEERVKEIKKVENQGIVA